MKVKVIANRTTARFVIYNPAPETVKESPEAEGLILYWPRPAAKAMAAIGQQYPEFLYLDVQAG